jgi:hypothetical protein
MAEMREQLKGQDLTFTEIAKVVGERWQVLEPELREQCERQANIAKENYYRQLAIYKKTPEYESYQKYLEDFKAKHGVVTQKGQCDTLVSVLRSCSIDNKHRWQAVQARGRIGDNKQCHGTKWSFYGPKNAVCPS